MSPDSMRVRLHLYRIRVVDAVVELHERVEVLVRGLRSVVLCPWCGVKTNRSTRLDGSRSMTPRAAPSG